LPVATNGASPTRAEVAHLAAIKAHATRRGVTLAEYEKYRADKARTAKVVNSNAFDPMRTQIYLALFPKIGQVNVGKARDGEVLARVRHHQARVGSKADGVWAIAPFANEMPWSDSQRVEHTAAGKLAANIGAESVKRKLEWLSYDADANIDWPREFARAVRQTLAFLGHEETPGVPSRYASSRRRATRRPVLLSVRASTRQTRNLVLHSALAGTGERGPIRGPN
jgi:hypothetical protein